MEQLLLHNINPALTGNQLLPVKTLTLLPELALHHGKKYELCLNINMILIQDSDRFSSFRQELCIHVFICQLRDTSKWKQANRKYVGEWVISQSIGQVYIEQEI